MKLDIEKSFVISCVVLGIIFIVTKTLEWVFM